MLDTVIWSRLRRNSFNNIIYVVVVVFLLLFIIALFITFAYYLFFFYIRIYIFMTSFCGHETRALQIALCGCVRACSVFVYVAPPRGCPGTKAARRLAVLISLAIPSNIF